MILRLTVENGTLAGRTFELASGFLTIGRGPNCSIRFDPSIERIASKQHAFIEARNDGFYLTDNKSLNGTFVNDQRIERTRINSGDRLQFGRNGVSAVVFVDQQAPMPDLAAAQFHQIEQAAQQQPANVQSSMSNIGLGQLEAVPEPSRTGRYVGIGFTIFAIVFLALIVVAITFASVGIIPAVIAAVVAFTPAVIYIFPLLWLDRYDPEPLWLLALSFAWGALVAVLVSAVANTVIGVAVTLSVSEDAGELAGAIISAPLFEEGSKGIGLLILLIFFRKYFDDILDGIVFGGVIALGFATVENVLYYGSALAGGGLGGDDLSFPSARDLVAVRSRDVHCDDRDRMRDRTRVAQGFRKGCRTGRRIHFCCLASRVSGTHSRCTARICGKSLKCSGSVRISDWAGRGWESADF